MPRHHFRVPQDMRDAVQDHVRRAIEGVSPKRYRQESPYLTAVAHALEGTPYDGPSGKVTFTSTVFDDRGRNSAESRLGADLAITADITSGGVTIRKAVIFQAKLGKLTELPPDEDARLRGQVEDMLAETRSPKVIEMPTDDTGRSMNVHSGRRFYNGIATRAVPLPEYVTSRVLTTLDGDTREPFINSVQDSSFPQVHITTLIASATV